MKTTVKVVTFKYSGKYYTEEESELDAEHADMHGFQLVDLFNKNDESVHKYSGVSSAFGSADFYHTIEVTYPDGVSKFCNFLLMKNGKRHGQ